MSHNNRRTLQGKYIWRKALTLEFILSDGSERQFYFVLLKVMMTEPPYLFMMFDMTEFAERLFT